MCKKEHSVKTKSELVIDGKKLRKLRFERLLNVQELADKAGINRYSITQMERGAWPGGSRPATVRKLGEALGIDPHELLEGAADPSARATSDTGWVRPKSRA